MAVLPVLSDPRKLQSWTLAIVILFTYPNYRAYLPLPFWVFARGRPIVDLPVEVVFSDAGVMACDAHGRTEYKWSAFVKARKAGDVYLMYTLSGNYLGLPFEALSSPEEFVRLDALLREKVADFAEVR